MWRLVVRCRVPVAVALAVLAVVVVAAASTGGGAGRPIRSAVLGGPLLSVHVPDGMRVVEADRGPTDLVAAPPVASRPVEVFAPSGATSASDQTTFVATTVEAVGGAVGRLTELEQLGSVEPVEVGGVEALRGELGLAPPVGSFQVARPVTPDLLLVVASETAGPDVLVEVAATITLGDDDRPVAGGGAGIVRIGGIGPDTFGRHSEVTTAYESDDGADRAVVSILRVTPAEERAFLAMMAGDPAAERRTEGRCCDPSTGYPPYEIDTDGLPGTIGTLGPSTRALVVGGEGGVVLLTDDRRGGRLFTDSELWHFAFFLRAVTAEGVDAFVAAA